MMAVVLLSLTGCATTTSQIVKPFVTPQYGMSKLQMIDLLGKPQSIEIYKKSDRTRVEFYVYLRPNRSTRETVPVCLVDNRVVGWGKAFYEDHISQDDIRIK